MPTVTVREHCFDVAAVVFDKDGTLLDLDVTWAPIAGAWVRSIAADDDLLAARLADTLGVDIGSGRLRPDSSFATMPLAEIAAATRGLLDAANWTLDEIERAVARAVATVDGVAHDAPMVALAALPELMTRLRAGGARLALFTNDERAATTMFLEHFDLYRLVDIVITAADVPRAKPAPDGLHLIAAALGAPTAELLMVGDSVADRDAALAAGSPFVAVGHASRASVGAHATINSVAELRIHHT